MTVVCNGRVLASRVGLARGFFGRLTGLLGKKDIGPEQGLLLLNCPSIHCFFMRFSIDAIYLSKDMTILHIETLPPWSVGKIVKHAAHVLELRAGAANGRALAGEKIEIRGIPSACDGRNL